jgi:sec-independent protein translocase protein TatA
MGSLSLPHLLILGAIALIFFGGRNKISDIMGDFAKGIKSFKKGLADDDEKPASVDAAKAQSLEHQPLTQAEINKILEARKTG